MNILSEEIGIEVDSSQPIVYQLAEAIHKFNEDIDGQDKLVKKAEKIFNNKVLEHISQQMVIHQVELSTILVNLEVSYSNVSSLLGNYVISLSIQRK